MKVSAADGNSAASDKVKVIEEGAGQDGRRGYNADIFGASSTYGRRDRYKAITGVQAEEISKTAKMSTRVPASKVLKAAEEEGRIGPRKSSIEPYQTKANLTGPQEEEGFTFGSFMKWLIIAAMLIALFLFFGGQVMNFMNSQEK